MAFSTQRSVSDGTLVSLALSIEYFERTEITVFFDGILSLPDSGLWAWLGTTDKVINFTPAVANGVEVMFTRNTALTVPRHQYTQGAQFIAETLDENFVQALRIVQEAKEGSGMSDVFNDLDLHGFKIRNTGAAVLPTDVVTLAQYQADAAGASAAKDTAVASAGAAATSEANALAYKNTAVGASDNAVAQVALATAQTGLATAQAVIATTQAGLSTTAKTASETARDLSIAAKDASVVAKDASAASASASAASAASVVRDGSGGVAGLTGYALNLWNALKTFKSSFSFNGTANRTHTLQDRDGTLADNTDLAGKANLNGSASETFSASAVAITSAAVNTNIEIGIPGTGTYPFIDFHSSTSVTDYDSRIAGSAGNATSGQGRLELHGYNITLNGLVGVGGADGTWGTAFHAQHPGGANLWDFGPDTGSAFVVYRAGTGCYIAAGSTAWTANSDSRIKDIIEPISDAKAKVNSLRTIIYKLKSDETAKRRVGFIAQDVQAVLPEAITVMEDELGTLGVVYTEVLPLVTAAVKEAFSEIDELRARIIALEQR